MFRIYGEVCKKNLKIFLLPAVCSVGLLAAVIFIVTDMRDSNAKFAAVICQQFFAWAGIFLLTPVFIAEQKDNIEETVLSKPFPVKTVYFIRFLEALAALVLFTTGFVLALSLMNGEISFTRYFAHTLAAALLLGSLGFMGTRFSGNIGVGYITAFGVYIMQMFLPDGIIEKAPHIYIFTLQNETYGIFPIYLFSLIFIAASFLKKR